MYGCGRAGSTPRAHTPGGAPGGTSGGAPGGTSGGASGETCRLAYTRQVGADTPTTCVGNSLNKQCTEHTAFRSHSGGATSHGHSGTHTTLPRRRPRSYSQLMLPPKQTVSYRHSVDLSPTLSETILPKQTNFKLLLLRNDPILNRHCDKVTEDDEKCSEVKLLQSASEESTLPQRCSVEVTPPGSGGRVSSVEVTPPGSGSRVPSAAADRVLRSRGAARAGGAILFLLFLLVSVRDVALAGGGGGLGAGAVCARAPGLTERQRALCRAAPAAMPHIAAGLRAAFAECRAQLAGRRWNCSGVGEHNLFAHVVPLATREAAFTYAVASAGVTHALSAACARGDLPQCGCAHRRGAGGAQWEWGAEGARCGHAAYGARLARRFLDARELERDARAFMNLHNNRLGRKMVKELVRVECKCHGVSGSCSVRTCWRALPPLARVARALRDKYVRARLVAGALAGGALGVVRARAPPRPPRRSELVYLAASPAYCEADARAAAAGTHGRRCNRTSPGEDGCVALCCGRGYFTQRTAHHVQCRCTFHWCCRVSCDTCLVHTDLHVCN